MSEEAAPYGDRLKCLRCNRGTSRFERVYLGLRRNGTPAILMDESPLDPEFDHNERIKSWLPTWAKHFYICFSCGLTWFDPDPKSLFAALFRPRGEMKSKTT